MRLVSLALFLSARAASAVRLETCAQTISASFRAACVAGREPLGQSLDVFVGASVDALRAGYDVDLLQLEVEVQDEGSLTASERAYRRRWLRAVGHTLEILSQRRPHEWRDADDIELAAFAAHVVGQQMRNEGVQLDRALATSGRSGDLEGPVAPNLVPLSQVVLLTMKRVWQLEADELYPGATG